MPDPNFLATVRSGGKILSNFLSITCRRDFTDGISFVEFAVAENVGRSMQLIPGNDLIVTLADQKFLTGYVCRRAVGYDAETHQVLISGRSAVGDVHDSSVKIAPGTLDGMTLSQVGKMVCKPHGVDFNLKNPPPNATQPFKSLRVQPGETGGEFLSRLTAARGMFLSDDVDGNAVAACGDTSAAVAADLVEGRNIKSFSGFMDDQTRFNTLTAVSQMPSPGQAAPARWYSTTATVDGVRPNRQRTFISEHPMDSNELGSRNSLEAAIADMQTIQASPTVVGWLRSNGQLWDTGLNVTLQSPMFYGAKIPMAVQAVTFMQDEEGTRTTLNLVKQNALSSMSMKGVQDLGGDGLGAGTPASQPDAPDWQT